MWFTAALANYSVKASVRPVMPLAQDASGSPVRPAPYAGR